MKYKIFTNTKNNNTMVSKNLLNNIISVIVCSSKFLVRYFYREQECHNKSFRYKFFSIIILKKPFERTFKLGYSLLMFTSVLLINSSYSQSLDSLLQLAVENNPELKSLQLEYEAELLKVNQVSQLPNPEIGVGVPLLRPETRLGAQVVMVSASQMFPWFGTLSAKEDIVINMSSVKFERISALKLNLFNVVKQAYYQLNFLNEKVKLIDEFVGVYRTLENISLSKVESGQSTIVDVLRIQLKIQDFNQELNIIKNKKLSFYAQINEVTNQSFKNEIYIKDDLLKYPMLDFNLENYQLKIKEHHPLMLKIDNEIELSKSKQQLNVNMNKPKIGLGLDYSLVSPRIDANPVNNGQDIFIPKVKVSIPLYRKSYHSKNEEEEIYQKSLNLKKETLENKMTRLLLQYKSNYDNAILNIELNELQITTIQIAYEVLLAQYSSEGNGFDDLLQVQSQLLSYKLGLSQSKLRAYQAKANIERLTDY